VRDLLAQRSEVQWALKWPTGSGGAGHRHLTAADLVPEEWPRPYLVQRFVVQAQPEVYRLYCVAGETFGWNVRRFPPGTTPSPWVAHARGARYETAGEAPAEAERQARAAWKATGLLGSFGCVDLLPDGEEWLVLEVGTDGLHGYVDRDVALPALAEEIDCRLAEAFWAEAVVKPWGSGPWRPRS
jgi:hypothetical protein